MSLFRNFIPWRLLTCCLLDMRAEFSCCRLRESEDRFLQVFLVRIQLQSTFCLIVFVAFFEEQVVAIAEAPSRKPCLSLAFWAIEEVEDGDSVAELDIVQIFKIH